MRPRVYIAACILAGTMALGCPVTAFAETSTAVAAVVETALEKAIEETQAGSAQASQVIEAGTGEETEEETVEEASAEVSPEEEALTQQQEAAAANVAVSQNLVNYALQFVGRPYRRCGNDPHTGADCSGFVRYVMQNGAGVSMNRSSRDQALQGRSISADAMQPGDLLFYAQGSRINHVAMYIGNGQIVHASTYKTGIKVSPWNYRNPVRIVSMLG